MSFYHLEKFLRKKVGNLLFNFRMNIVGPPVYVGLNIYCWLKDKDNTSHWLRNIYGNLDYTQESEIYTEIMSVYGNLDYIRESGIYIRKLWVFTEIWIIYENQKYIRKLWLFTEIRILTEIRSINGIKNKTATEIRKKETCSKRIFKLLQLLEKGRIA